MLLLLNSCQDKNETYGEIIVNKKFAENLWINTSDSLSGATFLKNQVVFFNDMKFEGDSIYDYLIVRKIKFKNSDTIFLGQYLKRINISDTLYNEIIRINDTSFTIKRNHKIETFVLSQ